MLDLSSVTPSGGGGSLISESGSSIRLGGSSAATSIDVRNSSGAARTLSGVAAGKVSADSTDAVNGSQLYAVQQQAAGLQSSVNRLDSRIKKVGAGAAALAALHPQDFDPADKWNFAVGYGNYRDASAMAVGAFYRPNVDTMVSIGGSMGNGENMMNLGLSLRLGKASPYAGMSRQDLVHELNAQNAEIKDLKAQNASQNERIAKLEEEVQQLLAK